MYQEPLGTEINLEITSMILHAFGLGFFPEVVDSTIASNSKFNASKTILIEIKDQSQVKVRITHCLCGSCSVSLAVAGSVCSPSQGKTWVCQKIELARRNDRS